MKFTHLLIAGLVGLAPTSGALADGEFRILNLDGRIVKWGEPTLGAGSRVTYAFAAEAHSFPHARNCRDLRPIAGITRDSDLDLATVRTELQAAFAAWERVADIKFEEASDPAAADILIGAQGRSDGYAFADVSPVGPDQPDAGPAYTASFGPGLRPPRIARIAHSLICLNPAKTWKTGFDGDLGVYDLRYTFIHEIGHTIGLDHPSGSGELMSFRYLETFREPQPGDIAGAVRLYGPPRPGPRD